jgi:hypothetical protein
VFYALYFGAKVSIWGTATPVLRENVLSDAAWAPYPAVVDKLFTDETARQAEILYLGPLKVEPWIGANEAALCNWMVGHDNKLSPTEMRKAFNWDPGRILVGSARETLRRSSLWRAGSALKHRILNDAGRQAS